MSNPTHILPADWRAEAIKFCETALRNWPGQLRLHGDVVNDIADALSFRDHQTRLSTEAPLREEIKGLRDELELWKTSEETASRQHDKREAEIASLKADKAALVEAFRGVRRDICEQRPDIITCIVWHVGSPNETTVDFIDATLAKHGGAHG